MSLAQRVGDRAALDLARRRGASGLANALERRLHMARNRMYTGTPYARNGIVSRTRSRQRYNRSYKVYQNRMKRRMRWTGGVTTQRDSRLIYRRKAMPSRMRKRYQRFRNKVLQVSEKDLGTQTVVFNRRDDIGDNTTVTRQTLMEFSLYGLHSPGYSPNNDMFAISAYIGAADQSINKGLSVAKSTNVIFKSAILDLTIRNSSGIWDGNKIVSDARCKVELDIYEISVRSDDDATVTYASVIGLLNANETKSDPIGGIPIAVPGKEISLQDRGATPWDMTVSLSRWGIKIWRKTKYIIPANDQITYQMRDPSRHSMDYEKLQNSPHFNIPRVTRYLVGVAKLAPGLDQQDRVVNSPMIQLNTGATRKYSFKVMNWTEDRTLYLNQL